MPVRVVIGPPCAGKTTFISEHAAAGDVAVDWDALAGALDAADPAPHAVHPPPVRALAWRVRAVAIAEALARFADADGPTAWLVHGQPTEADLERYVMGGARFVVLDPGETVALERADAEGRPESSRAAIRKWYADPPTISPAWLATDIEQKGGLAVKSKNVSLRVKAAAGEAAAYEYDLKEGEFVAYASTFDRDPDAYGDVIAAGAFARTLDEWAAKGDPIPLYFGHRMDDPDYNLGAILEAAEDERGLRVRGAIDLDGPKGAQVYRLIKARRLTELSFAYNVRDAATVTLDDGTKANELRDLDLLEVSLVPVGANRHTTVLAAKSAADAAARTAADFTDDDRANLDDAIDDLRDALATLEALAAPPRNDEAPETPADDTKPPAEDGKTDDAASRDLAAEATDAPAAKARVAAARARLAIMFATD